MTVPLLHFYHQRGCHYCILADGALDRFTMRHRGEFILVRHRMDLMDFPVQGWLPDASPAYALVIDGTLFSTHVGVLDEKGLARFISGKKRKKKSTRSRSEPIEPAIDEEADDDDEDEDEDE